MGAKQEAVVIEQDLADALKTAIVTKAMESKRVSQANSRIPEGTTVAFDITVNLKGVLARGMGYEAKGTSRLLSKAVLARLLASMGATRESARKALLAAAQDASQNVSRSLVEEDKELLMVIDEVETGLLEKAPKVRRSGAIKVHATSRFTKARLEPQTPGM